MKRVMSRIAALLRGERGASAVEYAILIAGIALALMAVIYGLGTNVNTKFTSVQTQLADSGGGGDQGGGQGQGQGLGGGQGDGWGQGQGGGKGHAK